MCPPRNSCGKRTSSTCVRRRDAFAFAAEKVEKPNAPGTRAASASARVDGTPRSGSTKNGNGESSTRERPSSFSCKCRFASAAARATFGRRGTFSFPPVHLGGERDRRAERHEARSSAGCSHSIAAALRLPNARSSASSASTERRRKGQRRGSGSRLMKFVFRRHRRASRRPVVRVASGKRNVNGRFEIRPRRAAKPGLREERTTACVGVRVHGEHLRERQALLGSDGPRVDVGSRGRERGGARFERARTDRGRVGFRGGAGGPRVRRPEHRIETRAVCVRRLRDAGGVPPALERNVQLPRARRHRREETRGLGHLDRLVVLRRRQQLPSRPRALVHRARHERRRVRATGPLDAARPATRYAVLARPTSAS